jgi:hypothetical protein
MNYAADFWFGAGISLAGIALAAFGVFVMSTS